MFNSPVEFSSGHEGSSLDGSSLREILDGGIVSSHERLLERFDEEIVDHKFRMDYHDKDKTYTVLTADGVKRGAIVGLSVLEKGKIDDFVDVLNSSGVDVWEQTAELEASPVQFYSSRLWMSRDRSFSEGDSTLPFEGEATTVDEGLFYGYPEEDVKAHDEGGLIDHNKIRSLEQENRLDGGVIDAAEYALLFGKEEYYEALIGLIEYGIRPEPEVLDETISEAKNRNQRLKEIEREYGVEVPYTFDI